MLHIWVIAIFGFIFLRMITTLATNKNPKINTGASYELLYIPPPPSISPSNSLFM
jgi:hypothetical protein